MPSAMVGTILIVEDDEGIAELERMRLEDAGYMTRIAPSAEAALRAIRAGGIDLVLLDYRLPGDVDGLELYARAKAEGSSVPVILVTGFANEATVIRALRAGVRDFVTKSSEYLDYLPEAVSQVLREVRTEHQLAESEARLVSVIASAKDAIILAEADHSISLFNPAAEQMFGCPGSKAVGRQLDDFIPAEYNPAALLAAESGGSVSLVRERTRGVRGNGDSFPLEASVSKTESGGRLIYTIVARDVTERRRAEERLREQAAMLDQATDAIVVFDLDGRVRYWNRGAERLYGWPAAEAIGEPFAELCGTGQAPQFDEAARMSAERGEWSGELSIVSRAGRAITVDAHWTLLKDRHGQPSAVLARHTDVTDQRKLEGRLRQAQKLQAIGQLAGGVAHDFNNLLTVIQGYTEMLMSNWQLDPGARELVAEVYRAGERAAGLTRQLLAFSRRQVLAPRTLDLNVLVREMEKMLSRLIGADINLASSLDSELGHVRADPGQVEQVVMNLAVNARDAMPRGGRLTIETRNVDLDLNYVREHPEVKSGRYVMLAVTDTGVGMDAATKARIFEPFFTTKEPGKGTGLGLATVHGIVQQSGGHIDIYSELGRGTSIKVYFPRLRDDAVRSTGSGVIQPVPRGSESILLVEDDDSIRSLARVALQSYGYTILEAADGQQGIEIGRDLSQTIHLLITDVILPKTGGREVVEAISAARPSLRVLYVSGYTNDAIVRHGVLESNVAFLQKPFTPTSLARKVREVLDARLE
jgi:two-component system, cell cycle sensor histidine kinase and response regulator CckA